MSNWALNSYTLNWTRGNGDNVMVVAKASSAPSDPTSGTSYTANAAYGSGDACGGGFVVYNGTGTSVNLTNLTDGTDYYFAVYEYNNTGVCYNMSQLTGNFLAGYCDPVVSSSGDDAGIAQVVLANTDGSAGGLDNSDAVNTNNSGYEDFTSSVGSALVEVGSSTTYQRILTQMEDIIIIQKLG